MNGACNGQASFAMCWAQVNYRSKVGLNARKVAVGSTRPEYPKSTNRKSGVGVSNAAIRISVRKVGGRTLNSRDVEGRRGGRMSFEHVSNAGGGVVVLRGDLVEKRQRLIVNSSIKAKLRASAWRRPLVRQEPQDGIRVGRFELLWQTKQRVYWQVVGAEYRQEGVLSILHIGKRMVMDDAAVGAATKRAGSISHTEVAEPLGSRAHGKALS